MEYLREERERLEFYSKELRQRDEELRQARQECSKAQRELNYLARSGWDAGPPMRWTFTQGVRDKGKG